MSIWNVGEMVVRKRDSFMGKIEGFDPLLGHKVYMEKQVEYYSPEEMEEHLRKPTEKEVLEEKERRRLFLEKLKREVAAAATERQKREEEEQKTPRQRAEALAVEKGYAMHLPTSECSDINPEDNPRDFNGLVEYCLRNSGSLTLSANPKVAEKRALEMGNYVIPVSENANDLKCNVSVRNSTELGDLQKAMKFNVHTNGWTNGFAEVEICSKALAYAIGPLAAGQRGIISERYLNGKKNEGEQ